VERRRHVVNVRVDGLAPVLGGLLRDVRVRSAGLIDVDSGMVLDAWTSDPDGADLEVQGAGHADLVRVALGVLGDAVRPPGTSGTVLGEGAVMVVGEGAGPHHVLRVVRDSQGGLLALAVVVVGPERVVNRVRRRLRGISAAALTAGPSMVRRPSAVRRLLEMARGAPSRPAPTRDPPVLAPVPPARTPAYPGVAPLRVPDAAPAPPSALPPGPRRGG
jgi:hypothetical protein